MTPCYPEGFEYVPQLLTRSEEKNLVDEVVKINLASFIFQGFNRKGKWHRDAPSFNIIVGISLNEDCVFRLRPHEKMSISFVKDVRYSITLRTLKSESTNTG